jgi:hypothetical protein
MLFFEMVQSITPNYITALLPPHRGELINHPALWNANNYHIPNSRLTAHKRSFIPNTTSLWNNLDEATKMCRTLNSFKLILKKKITPVTQPLFQLGKGNGHINLGRMRMGLSGLNCQRHNFNLIESPICTLCNGPSEDVIHYFFKCPHYAAQRTKLLRGISQLLQPSGISMANLDILSNLMLNGCPILNRDSNLKLTEIVVKYIDVTK